MDDVCKHDILGVQKFTANQYCICLSIPQIYTLKADAVQICGEILDTQYYDMDTAGSGLGMDRIYGLFNPVSCLKTYYGMDIHTTGSELTQSRISSNFISGIGRGGGG